MKDYGQIVQSMINELSMKIAPRCLCEDCCYWRTICNTWVDVKHKLELPIELTFPKVDECEAHKNGRRF